MKEEVAVRSLFQRIVIAVVLAASSLVFARSQADADNAWSVLPDVGGSQSYAAVEHFSVPGGVALPGSGPNLHNGHKAPHEQSGTLTVTRLGADATRVEAKDGLDAFDQTLHTDAQESITQPSPGSPFVDLLENAAAIFSAAPAGAHQGAQWHATIAPPSWLSDNVNPLPKELSSIPLTLTVGSVTGNTVNVHGDGKSQYTPGGEETISFSVAIDCTVRAGRFNSCTRSGVMGIAMRSGAAYDFTETTSLAPK